MATSSRMSELGIGSDEVPEYVCDRCLKRQLTVKAVGFCNECSDNLCEYCLDFHGRSKVFCHHDTSNRPRNGNRKSYAKYSELRSLPGDEQKKPTSLERSNGLGTSDKKLTGNDKQPNKKVNGENITKAQPGLYEDDRRFSALRYKFVINIPDSITGCAVLSTDRLVLASHSDRSVYIVDLNKNTVVDKLVFKTLYPDDVAGLPLQQIAIIAESENAVIIIDLPSRKLVKDIPLKRKCSKVQAFQNLLYILCKTPNSVMVFDLNGDLQRDVALPSGENQPFLNPCGLSVSKDMRHLYVCDDSRGIVAKLLMTGEIVAQTSTKSGRDTKITLPVSLIEIDDGSLIVLGGSNFYYVSADFKEAAKLMEAKDLSIVCYVSERQQIFGVKGNEKVLNVYSVEYSSAGCRIA